MGKKIVINKCFGGFSISKEALLLLRELGAVTVEDEEINNGYSSHYRDIARDNPALIQVIEKIGVDAASGGLASLEIVEIPDDVEWVIEEYDGNEWISEKHRTWG